jgi:hypothetical protein
MSVERHVKFWQITNGHGEALPGPFPATDLVKKVKKFDVDGRRYTHSDGWILDGVAVSSLTNPHLALYRIRHENLPSVEQGGAYSDLQLLDDQNLAEATHFRFFPRNIVAQLHNHDGPGVSRLVQFMRNHVGVDIALAPVLREDAVKTLARLNDITQLEFKIPVKSAHLLESSGHRTISALRTMAEESLSRTLFVKVTIWGSTEPNASSKWRQALESVVQGDVFSAFESLKVRAHDEATDDRQTVDLVKEQLTMTQKVELTSEISRSVKPSSAAGALQNAYNSLEGDLKEAVPAFPENAAKVPLSALKTNGPKTSD